MLVMGGLIYLGVDVGLALAGAAVLARSGLFNVAASSGHFKITVWFLYYGCTSR
jgi:hypothetical protein